MKGSVVIVRFKYVGIWSASLSILSLLCLSRSNPNIPWVRISYPERSRGLLTQIKPSSFGEF